MAADNFENLLEELTNVGGPSGFEEPVRRIVERELEPVVDTREIDGLGSAISILTNESAKYRVLLTAHMDELGLLVKRITPEGFLKFQPIGGWLPQAIIGQRWIVKTHKTEIAGVTGIKTVHVMSAKERAEIFDVEGMFIDVGATSDEDARNRLGVRPGDPVYPDSKFKALEGGARLIGKAWDDRVGVAVLIQVMKNLAEVKPPITVVGAATVQEEIGLRGAQTSGYLAEADIAINLESGVAGDYPSISLDEAQEQIGAGPSIFFHDSSMIPNTRFRDFVVDLAERENIPIQFNVLSGYGQDGSAIQRTRGGAPVVNIGVPTRYLHSHQGLVARSDIDECVRLVTKIVTSLADNVVENLRSFD
ncbi:MAG TPA: M42 family peptidase [Dehalococcoidia bacterium]|jgi:endoglucanase|nr:M42 family peptidase [Dehalococcoidia bacterium]